MYITAFFASFV